MAIKEKKGVFNILFAIIFLSLFIIIFLTFNQAQYQEKTELTSTRVLSIDNFINDFHKDLDRAAYISGFRTLIALEEYVSVKGEFFSNQEELETSFKELFLNGTLNGTSYDVMTDSTFNNYLNAVQKKAHKLDINLSINVTNITLNQSTPWFINVLFETTISVADRRGTAEWNYSKNFSTKIPINDLKDPLYAVKTLGKVPITIKKYTLPAEGFVADDNSTTALKEFINTNYYIANPDAPSYLQRFIGDLNPNPAGIESMVNLPLLSDQGVVVYEDRSVVDHIYFSNSPGNASDRCSIQGLVFTPDWFRLDEDHLDFYEVKNLNYINCT